MKALTLMPGFLISGLLIFTSCIKQTAEQPNFLFIIADDQAPHTLKAYGNEVCQTPNLNRLAEEGIVFDAAHHMGSWSGAVCLPSRTMIQTSFNVWRTEKIKDVKQRMNPKTYVHEPDKWMSEMTPDYAEYYSMPVVFNRAGYSTFRTCKFGNTFEASNRLYTARNDGDKRGIIDEEGSWWHGEQVMEFLRKRETSKEKDPFLIFYGFTHPHDPRNGKPELLAKYGAVNENIPTVPNPKAPPLQVNYLPAHPFHHGHPGLRDEERVQGVMLKRDEATIRNELGREYACIENIDIQIGTVLDKLEEMGELDNTYVIFTADHGIAVGRHGLAGKQNLYEHTWRVPFIVRGPGIKAGSRALGNIYLMDILPTLCDLADIEQAETMDGFSFKPVLLGEKESIRDVMYGVYCGGTKPGMRSVKKGKWKLIKYDVLDGEVRETQLFNLDENPHEFLIQHHEPTVAALTGVKPESHQVNLADDPAYAEKRREMEALLLEEMKKWGDPYRLWDQQ
jgi:arylsulfatase A-like enzyme